MNNAGKLIFACSGAADVGAIADQAARQLNRDGWGKMYCSVGVGGRVKTILNTVSAAEKILAIDGCPLDCVRNCLEQAGFNNYFHLRVTDLGMKEGKSPLSTDRVAQVVQKARQCLES